MSDPISKLQENLDGEGISSEGFFRLACTMGIALMAAVLYAPQLEQVTDNLTLYTAEQLQEEIDRGTSTCVRAARRLVDEAIDQLSEEAEDTGETGEEKPA